MLSPLRPRTLRRHGMLFQNRLIVFHGELAKEISSFRLNVRTGPDGIKRGQALRVNLLQNPHHVALEKRTALFTVRKTGTRRHSARANQPKASQSKSPCLAIPFHLCRPLGTAFLIKNGVRCTSERIRMLQLRPCNPAASWPPDRGWEMRSPRRRKKSVGFEGPAG